MLFAVVHAYWSAGGEPGMHGEPADSLGAQLYIALIGALGLAEAPSPTPSSPGPTTEPSS